MNNARKVDDKIYLDAFEYISPMMDLVSRCVRAKSVSYNGKTYHNKECDLDDVYDMNGCPKIRAKKIQPSQTPTYNCNWDGSEVDSYFCDKPDIIELNAQLDNYDVNQIFFENFDSITFKNIRGMNTDHRGADHCDLALKFEPTISMTQTFSLDQLIQIYFRLKSRKFDHWYELYCGCKKVSKKNKNIEVCISFDHGS